MVSFNQVCSISGLPIEEKEYVYLYTGEWIISKYSKNYGDRNFKPESMMYHSGTYDGYGSIESVNINDHQCICFVKHSAVRFALNNTEFHNHKSGKNYRYEQLIKGFFIDETYNTLQDKKEKHHAEFGEIPYFLSMEMNMTSSEVHINPVSDIFYYIMTPIDKKAILQAADDGDRDRFDFIMKNVVQYILIELYMERNDLIWHTRGRSLVFGVEKDTISEHNRLREQILSEYKDDT